MNQNKTKFLLKTEDYAVASPVKNSFEFLMG